jgi:hypothetical protein
MGYSLFIIERLAQGYTWNSCRDDEQRTVDLIEKCWIYVDTFNTLEEAKIVQKKYEQTTLILPSY